MFDQSVPDLPPLPANQRSRPAAADSTKTSGLAIASLVLGILACPLSIVAGLPGLICGIMGLIRIFRSERAAGGPRLTGQGFAIAGIVLSGLLAMVLPILAGVIMPAMQITREQFRRSACVMNLRVTATAMNDHQAKYGLLPAVITAADGRPLLSWRVAILPLLGEYELYEEFHLDEPWDSEHNRTLIARMPRIFACPSAPLGEGKTRYLLLDGPGTSFEKSRLVAGEGPAARVRGVRAEDLVGPPAETLLLVEAPTDRAVEWTKPEELTVSAEEARSFEDAGGHPGGIRHGAYADGKGKVEIIHPH